MSKKFIPNGDLDFSTMAQAFARNVAKEPERFGVAQADAEDMTAKVERYRAALQASRFGGAKSQAATRAKDDARDEAEKVIRRLAHIMRANSRLDVEGKVMLGLRQRTARAKPQTVPPEPPRLRFVRALHEGGATPVHELDFRGFDGANARPGGAVRLELFVDLVPPEEKIPGHPGPNLASRPWYLRSYTRSPIRLTPPMARVPMRVVYWGRWADALGNVGPFSATAAGWIEGGSHHGLPGGVAMHFGRLPAPVAEHEPAAPGPADRERHYSVAVLEAQRQALLPEQVPAPEREQRRLEGPETVEEAA